MTQRKPLPRNVKLLGWASFLNDVASEMIYPLLPQFLIGVLGGNKFYLGLVEGIAESVASLLKLGSGAWSDHLKQRKWLVVAGYLLATVSRPFIGLATAPWHLFAARTADRVGKGIRTSPRDALIADSTEADARGHAFGFHRAMDHAGAAVGPLLALLVLWLRKDQLREQDLRLVFLLTLLPGLVVVALLMLGLREPVHERPPKEKEPGEKPGEKPPGEKPARFALTPPDGNFRLYLISLVIFTLGNSSDAFLLVRAQELGVSVVLLPLLWFVFHVCKSGGNYAMGRVVDRFGSKLPLLGGWMIYVWVYVGFAFAWQEWQAWALFLVYAAFYALSEPSEKTLVTRLAGDERKGLAFGWYNFALGIAALPASLVFGELYDLWGAAAAFCWGAGLALAAALLLLGVRTPPRDEKQHP